jgi:hypothetical protein
VPNIFERELLPRSFAEQARTNSPQRRSRRNPFAQNILELDKTPESA